MRMHVGVDEKLSRDGQGALPRRRNWRLSWYRSLAVAVRLHPRSNGRWL